MERGISTISGREKLRKARLSKIKSVSFKYTNRSSKFHPSLFNPIPCYSSLLQTLNTTMPPKFLMPHEFAKTSSRGYIEDSSSTNSSPKRIKLESEDVNEGGVKMEDQENMFLDEFSSIETVYSALLLQPEVKNCKLPFHKNFSFRKLIPSHFFPTTYFLSKTEESALENQKWDTLLKTFHRCHKNLIVEFYENLVFVKTVEEPICVSWVNGTRIVLNPKIVGLVLGIPSNGFTEYLEGDWSPSYPASIICSSLSGLIESTENPYWTSLVQPYYNLFEIVQTLIPRLNNQGGPMNSLEATLVYLLGSSVSVSLPHLILCHMRHAISHPELSLPYGGWLTKVLIAFGIPHSEEPTFLPPKIESNAFQLSPSTSASSVRDHIALLISKFDWLQGKVDELLSQNDEQAHHIKELKELVKGIGSGKEGSH